MGSDIGDLVAGQREAIADLTNHINHLYKENVHLRDLVCFLRGNMEGATRVDADYEMKVDEHLVLKLHGDFFARKEMEDAWDIIIQQEVLAGE